MKGKIFKPLMWLVLFMLLVGLACGMPKQTEETVEQSQAQQTEEPSGKTDQTTKKSTKQSETSSSGAVSSLVDVKSATIQIEAQGTFIDPEFGYQANVAGRGSGFIIDPTGLAVTNNHVVTGAALLKVWVGGDQSKTYNAKVVAVSECSDLALIDIDGDGFPYLEWRDGPVSVGLEVYAAGFPLGDPEFTLTKGIVSKEKADGETNWASIDSVIEHDATINPGNSGGPLIDEEGKVVGINYAAYKSADQYFAIGKDLAKNVIEQLKTGNNLDSIGVNGVAVVSDDETLSGIWVSSVKSGSPADKAGVKGGDIITTMEGLYIATDGTMADYCDILRTHNPGDTLSIEVLRWSDQEYLAGQLNGKPLQTSFTFADNIGEQEVETGGGDASGTYSEYVTVQDDTEVIEMQVPSSWSDINGKLWESDWGDIHFVAADIQAAPDLDDFNAYYSAPGVDFAASKDWGKIGGYVQLLDGTRHWYQDDCDLDGRYDYEDMAYEGKYDLWNCGADSVVIVLSARPISDPLAYLTLVQVQIATDADLDALDKIMNTFDVIGNLP